MTQILKIDANAPQSELINEAAKVLLEGQLVAFPTETVYGLGGVAFNAEAVAKIFEAKGRPATDPLIVHIHSLNQLSEITHDVPDVATLLMEQFWPGPLTLLLPRSSKIPANVSAGLPTVAVRMPIHPVATALLKACNVPIAAPSANLFSHSSPTTAQHVYDDLAGRIPLILDGGTTNIGVESTIVDVSSARPRLLRPGGISLDQLRPYLPQIEVISRFAELDEGAVPAPGMLLKHYSPHAELRLFEGTDQAVHNAIIHEMEQAQQRGQKVGILAAVEDQEVFKGVKARVIVLGSLHDLEQVASNLFAGMRDLDTAGVDIILARTYPIGGIGLAIQDRLLRAAEGKVIKVT